MIISFEVRLTDPELNYVRDFICTFREEDNKGRAQLKDLERLVNEGMSLADAFMASKHSSQSMKEILESIEDEDLRDREAEMTYGMIKMMDEDKVRMPVFFDDRRLVFNDFSLIDIESFVQGLMSVEGYDFGDTPEEAEKALSPEGVLNRFRKYKSAITSTKKIIDAVNEATFNA